MIIWNQTLDYWRECHKRAGYVEIKTPSMMIKELWERSGHWQNYRENMFTCCVEEREFAIKADELSRELCSFIKRNKS